MTPVRNRRTASAVAPVMDDERTGPREDAARPGSAHSGLGPAVGMGAAAFLVTVLAARLVLVNLHGPLGDHAGLGVLVTLAVAATVAVPVALAAHAIARRSTWGLVGLAGGLAALVVVAFPTRVDRHESFVPRPNERSSCAGLTFDHYPPGTMDGSRDVYCVGVERPLPAG